MQENYYDEFLDELRESLEQADATRVDEVLQTLHSWWLSEREVATLDEIIAEATLYLELKEEEYREMALVLIRELEEV